MEAEKKARELVDKMLAVYDIDGIAIDCALIAVDEIIEVLVELSEGKFTFIHNVEYWQEVKQQIKKL
jgi:hypothetical protein